MIENVTYLFHDIPFSRVFDGGRFVKVVNEVVLAVNVGGNFPSVRQSVTAVPAISRRQPTARKII